MADTQHNLRIKAILDTSQLQQEIERLNGQKPGGGGGGASGAARSTSSLLSKLDSTLNRLNSTMQQMNSLMQRHGSSSSSAQIPLFYPIGGQPFSFARPGGRQTTVRPAAVHPDVRIQQPKPPSPPQMANLSWGPTAGPLHQQLAPGGAMKSWSDISQLATNMTKARVGMEGRGPVVIPPAGRNWIDRISQYFSYQQSELEKLWKMGNDSHLFADVDTLQWLQNLKPTGKMVHGKGLGKSSFRKFPAGFSAEIEKYIQARSNFNAASTPRPSRPANPLNPPIVSENVMHVFPDGTFQLLPRNAPAPSTRPSSSSSASFSRAPSLKHQLRSLGVGAITHMIGSQLNELGHAAEEGSITQRGISGIGSMISGAGSGAMIGSAFGPAGAGIGAILGALSSAAVELAKSFSALDARVKEAKDRMNIVKVSAGGSLDSILAREVVLGSPAEAMLERSRENLNALKSQRKDILARELGLSQGTQTTETAEQLKQLAKQREVIEKEIAAEENVISTINDRKRALDDEVLAGQKLAQAEIEFADAIRRNEEAERNRHYSDSEENVQAYRTAQRQHREQMRQRDIQAASFERDMDFQRSQAKIRLGMWRGGTAEDYFRDARTKRQSLVVLNAARSRETDPQKLRQFSEDITALQSEFQQTMMIGQLLKNLGNPLQKMQLGSLTSLANRGVNMGERTEMQRPYDKKMDQMVDILQNIEENTRAAEKAIWE